MTRREIAALACRLLALALFAYGWERVCHVLTSYFFSRSGASLLDQLSYGGTTSSFGLFAFVAGAIIWFRAPIYGRRIFPDDDDEVVTASGVTSQDVIAVACCVAGIWLAAPAVAALLKLVAEIAVFTATAGTEELAFDSLLGRVIPDVVLVASGLFLILRSRGLSEAVRRLRNLGQTESTEPATEHTP
ncbi:MAG: hypothetical protein QM775_13980 [Pirellulales bacterium]